jgi:uncharacterized protein YcfL
MKRIAFVRLVAAVVVVGVVAGCTPQNVRSNQELVPGPSIDQSYPGAKLVLGSEDLVGEVRLSNAIFRPVGQLTQAQVTVQNLTDTRYTLEYKFDWEDANGFAIGSLGTWHRFKLTPRHVAKFTSTGKTPEATNIIFTVRLPDDVFIHSDRETRRQNPENIDY